MKNDQYFKHDTGASGNRKLMQLIDEEGMKGYGAYWLLLETLRMQKDYRAPLGIVRRLAKRSRVMPAFLMRIICNYDLFVVEADCFYSPGMTRRMRPYTAKITPPLPDDGNEGAANPLVNSKTALRTTREEEKNEKEKRKKGEGEKKLPPAEVDRLLVKESVWEACIDSAFLELSWVEIQAMHSQMGSMFAEHLPEIIAFFKRHVRTYGKESTVCTVADAKNYFSNFIRPASATQKALLAEMRKQAERWQRENPYRYETLDPDSGQRTYFGQVIPTDAPPRPSETSVWDEEKHRWGR